MIRDATLDDIPSMIAMGARFAERCNISATVGFNPVTVEALLTNLIENGNGICLVGDGCMAGALLYPHPFNHEHVTGQELFWWSEGREGMAMIDALETRAKEKGASSFAFIALEAIRPEATARIYQRHGYAPLERIYMKVL